MLKEKLNVAKSEILRISPVLGVHTGPGALWELAVLYLDFVDGRHCSENCHLERQRPAGSAC
jgi:hypothetical protein